jgi:hypothetical protein
MKKPYQIESQRAVKQLAEMAAEGNPAVQMVLPLAEMIGWLRKGVGELIRQAGLQLMDLMMQEEVRASLRTAPSRRSLNLWTGGNSSKLNAHVAVLSISAAAAGLPLHPAHRSRAHRLHRLARRHAGEIGAARGNVRGRDVAHQRGRTESCLAAWK